MATTGTFSRAITAVLFITVASSLAPRANGSTQYTGIALYPLVPPASDYLIVNVNGAGGGQTVGYGEVIDGGTLSLPEALMWQADGTPTNLDPTFASSEAMATNGLQEVGYLPVLSGQHAYLWSGSAASVIDLHPANLPGIRSSQALGLSASQQVGAAQFSDGLLSHAMLWNGTAASAVDLNPKTISLPGNSGTVAVGTDGVHQVGYGGPYQGHHALMWSGTAASAVDLTPPGFTDAIALGAGGNQEVGQGTASNGGGALLWTGSAASVVGLGGNIAVATNGKQQVGQAGNHAVVWSGSAASMVDLNAFLSSQFSMDQLVASSIDAAGNIFGSGVAGGFAFEWLPHAVLPGDANLDGKVDFTDLIALARHYGQTAGWVQGDFDQDGKTDFNDLVILARHYGQMLGPADVAPSQVPEPALLPLVSLIALLRIRRR